MRKDEDWTADLPADDDTTAVGIVVQDGATPLAHPHLAFVWGPPEVRPAPSLPFGRWKAGVKAA